jgi:hypothetical protein
MSGPVYDVLRFITIKHERIRKPGKEWHVLRGTRIVDGRLCYVVQRGCMRFEWKSDAADYEFETTYESRVDPSQFK